VTRDPCGRGRPGRRTQDVARATDVGVHARLADPQELCDLLRREAARDGAQHLALTIGQPGGGPGAARKDSPRQHITGYEPDHHGSGALHPEGERPRLAV